MSLESIRASSKIIGGSDGARLVFITGVMTSIDEYQPLDAYQDDIVDPVLSACDACILSRGLYSEGGRVLYARCGKFTQKRKGDRTVTAVLEIERPGMAHVNDVANASQCNIPSGSIK